MFAIVKDSNHYDAIKSMIRLIGEADKADGYIDYILDKEGYVHNQHKGHTTHMVTRTPIYTTLAKVRSLQSVEKSLLTRSIIPNMNIMMSRKNIPT